MQTDQSLHEERCRFSKKNSQLYCEECCFDGRPCASQLTKRNVQHMSCLCRHLVSDLWRPCMLRPQA